LPAGAEFAIIPANSVHFAFDEVMTSSSIPVLNIVELAADDAKDKGCKKVGVLGVGLTMEGRLYEQPLVSRKLESISLKSDEQSSLNSIIYNELVQGAVNDKSVEVILGICEALRSRGCDALILACTELPMALNSSNCPLPFIDTTSLLAEKAVAISLG
jgi:aspartate racemase